MKQVITDVLMTTVLAENFLHLRSEKGSGVGVLPHVYARSFAARHLETTFCEMIIQLVLRMPHKVLFFLVNLRYLKFAPNLVY